MTTMDESEGLARQSDDDDETIEYSIELISSSSSASFEIEANENDDDHDHQEHDYGQNTQSEANSALELEVDKKEDTITSGPAETTTNHDNNNNDDELQHSIREHEHLEDINETHEPLTDDGCCEALEHEIGASPVKRPLKVINVGVNGQEEFDGIGVDGDGDGAVAAAVGEHQEEREHESVERDLQEEALRGRESRADFVALKCSEEAEVHGEKEQQEGGAPPPPINVHEQENGADDEGDERQLEWVLDEERTSIVAARINHGQQRQQVDDLECCDDVEDATNKQTLAEEKEFSASEMAANDGASIGGDLGRRDSTSPADGMRIDLEQVEVKSCSPAPTTAAAAAASSSQMIDVDVQLMTSDCTGGRAVLLEAPTPETATESCDAATAAEENMIDQELEEHDQCSCLEDDAAICGRPEAEQATVIEEVREATRLKDENDDDIQVGSGAPEAGLAASEKSVWADAGAEKMNSEDCANRCETVHHDDADVSMMQQVDIAVELSSALQASNERPLTEAEPQSDRLAGCHKKQDEEEDEEEEEMDFIPDGTYLAEGSLQLLEDQLQDKSCCTPLTPPILVEDEEDLEREFDEEPEFERRQVSVRRHEDARSHYELAGELGRGKFGTVYRCTERTSGRQLAAKFISMRRLEDREDVEREVDIMRQLQHKRLLQLYDAFDDGLKEMCLITELVEGGELFERIVDDDFDLTEKKAAIFMRQICEGVEYMQAKQIVHLDMKPENILCLSRTGNRIKLIDFGLARKLAPEEPLRVMFGTPDFAAPEVLTYECVTFATDMWSVGVICYVLLSGLSPFMGDNDLETMANVTKATFDFNYEAFEPITDFAKDFIARLLVRAPEKRLKPSECLQHAWLQRGGGPISQNQLEQLMSCSESEQATTLQQQPSPPPPPTTTFATNRLCISPSDSQILSACLQAAADATPHFRPRASFGGESTTSGVMGVSLDKRRLKRYVVRRKWHKTVHAIMALGRMGASFKNVIS